jgi:hypothetical protein
VPLTLSEVRPSVDSSGIPFSFAIAIAVHSNDVTLADVLNAAIRKNHSKAKTVLAMLRTFPPTGHLVARTSVVQFCLWFY